MDTARYPRPTPDDHEYDENLNGYEYNQTPDYPRRGAPSVTKPKNKGGAGFIIAVIVILLAIGAMIAYLVIRLTSPPADTSNAGSPAEAVEAYLTAISQGDATTALSYSAQQPSDTTFTSNSFLLASMQAHPMTSIVVPEGQSTSTPAVINATYTLGEHQVNAHFTVQQHGTTWLLDGGFISLNISALMEKGVPLTLNGVDLNETTRIYLFPGVYTFASTNPMLALTDPIFTMEYPESSPTFSQKFVLSAEALTRVAAAADSRMDHCLNQKEMKPEGCGFGFSGVSEGEVDPATIEWSLADEAPDFTSIQYQLDPTLTLAEASLRINVDFEAISVDKAHLYEASASILAMRADFSNPDQIVITFY